MNKYAGADWVHRNTKQGATMSELGVKVANILGDVFFGIYHLAQNDLNNVDWSNNYVICVRLEGRDIATVDGDVLTRLVVLAHDRMIRISIHPLSKRAIELMFHNRETRESTAEIWKRCPTMEDHVQSIRNHYQEEE